nr:thiamine phosphate synthase [uncultured Campylobacter sp.]
MSEIYALSDDTLTPPQTIFLQIDEILRCGVKLVQYRSKLAVRDEALIRSLIGLCEDYGAKLIINDDAALAKKLGAHGVHIGKDDGETAQVREFLGADKIVGVSCYADLARAQKAEAQGASYVAFGSLRHGKTKPDAPLCPGALVQEARKSLNLPIAVIGGIGLENLNEILALKPDYIAMVEAIYRPASITQNLTNLKEKMDEYI